MTLYAYFDRMDVHTNAHPELFSVFGTTGMGEAIIVPANPLALQGKVTIPKTMTRDGEVLNVVELRNFNTCSELTHVFFERGSLVNTINTSCFNNSNGTVNKLIYIEPIDSMRTIYNYAFTGCHLRIDLTDSDYIVGGPNLIYVGSSAFQNAFASETSGRTLIVPSSVTTIGFAGFGWENNMRNCIIQLGDDSGTPSQWDAQNNPSYNNTVEYGHRFAQNDYNISLVFYSNKYTSLNDIIPPRSGYADTGITLEQAIHDANSHLSISFVHVE